MAAAPDYLSLDQFERLYGREKPHYEYWFGEAIQKSMPTSLHGLVQLILGMLLFERGWVAASEVRLKISEVAQPVPDLVASATGLQFPYPDAPLDLCIEILSPGDTLRDVFSKAAYYLDWKIGSVWIIDPDRRRAHMMSLKEPGPIELSSSDALKAGSGDRAISIPVNELFDEIDRRVNRL